MLIFFAEGFPWFVKLSPFVSVVVLGGDTMWICKQIPTFQRNILSPSSEAVCFSRMVSTYKLTWRHNTEYIITAIRQSNTMQPPFILEYYLYLHRFISFPVL
jgi:hypothetical protein